MISWIWNYGTILLWAVPIIGAYVAARYFLGLKLSLPVGILGGALLAFLLGKKMQRDNQRKYVQDIEEKREKAYEKIDRRNTSDVDVVDRLRNGDF